MAQVFPIIRQLLTTRLWTCCISKNVPKSSYSSWIFSFLLIPWLWDVKLLHLLLQHFKDILFQLFNISVSLQIKPKRNLYVWSLPWCISCIKVHQSNNSSTVHPFPSMYPTWKKDSRVMFLGLIQWPKLNKPTSHRLGWLAPLRSTSKKQIWKTQCLWQHIFGAKIWKGGNRKKQLKWLAGQVLGMFVSIYILYAPAWIVRFTNWILVMIFFELGKGISVGCPNPFSVFKSSLQLSKILFVAQIHDRHYLWWQHNLW